MSNDEEYHKQDIEYHKDEEEAEAMMYGSCLEDRNNELTIITQSTQVSPPFVVAALNSLFSQVNDMPWLILLFSAICGGLGNSLEPVAMLSFLQLYLLVFGYERSATIRESLTHVNPIRHWFDPRGLFSTNLFILITQAFGFCLGYSSMFGYPTNTFGTIMMSVGAGILMWILIILLALLPHLYILRRYPSSMVGILVFPTGFTVVNHCIVGPVFSTFPAIGNAVLDIGPLRTAASLFGIGAVTYLLAFVATLLSILHLGHVYPSRRSQLYAACRSFVPLILTVLCLLFVITGFIAQSDAFYQKNVSTQITPSIPVSCIFAQNAKIGSTDREQVWNETITRAQAGDQIILWSEETFYIESEDDEQAVLLEAMTIAKTESVYIGIAYELWLTGNEMATNQFALISSSGEVIWNYLKAHPVPLIESTVRPGPAKMPIHSSPFGKLSGAICFDLDFPHYIRQAGAQKVDIVLQPSWTWNAINSRHFDGDAVRSVENGFTLFRCSSNGESGIVGPSGEIKARKYTGHAPYTPAVFQLPLQSQTNTLFVGVGFVFDWVCLAVLIGFYFVTFAPNNIVREVEKLSRIISL